LNGRELLCAVTSTALLPIIHILSSESARKVMIMREHELSVTKQVKALRMSRGSVYYLPRPVSATDLEIVRLLDRLHLVFPSPALQRCKACCLLRGARSAGVT
jgi:hypothetical protein